MNTTRIEKRLGILLIALAALVLASLACGSAYTTARRTVGRSGHVEIKADGVTESTRHTVEIDEDFWSEDVQLAITAEIQGGSFQVDFLDDDDTVVVSLAPSPGSPDSGTGTFTTDMSGEITYRVVAENAQGVKISIDYQF